MKKPKAKPKKKVRRVVLGVGNPQFSGGIVWLTRDDGTPIRRMQGFRKSLRGRIRLVAEVIE
jgi:hypothetical protein